MTDWSIFSFTQLDAIYKLSGLHLRQYQFVSHTHLQHMASPDYQTSTHGLPDLFLSELL